ncbi:MAG TPA: Dabb family protein [Nitriliruptoraceae bacterium]|nr:Dabb family protein [Nitriliruptoraceae bacterium]
MLRDDATIRHTVSFRLRPEADRDAFLGRFGALADIDGVQDFQLLVDVGDKNDFTHGATMVFADQAAYDAYDQHPDHQAFVADVWMRDVADFLEVDHQRLGS